MAFVSTARWPPGYLPGLQELRQKRVRSACVLPTKNLIYKYLELTECCEAIAAFSPRLQTVISQECGEDPLFCQQLSSFVAVRAQKQSLPVFLTPSSCLPPQAEPADRVQESDFSQPAFCGVGFWAHQSQHADAVRAHLFL